MIQNLVSDIKLVLVELHEDEKFAIESKNPLYANGLSQARIMIENVLEKHGYQRPSRIDVCSNNPLTINP